MEIRPMRADLLRAVKWADRYDELIVAFLQFCKRFLKMYACAMTMCLCVPPFQLLSQLTDLH
jgi:hypothetical protein